MENINGLENRDEIITAELNEASIAVYTKPNCIFPTIGKLGKFDFIRGVDGWLVNGDVPLEIAMELHNDPLGKETILVVAHHGFPSPDELRPTDLGSKRSRKSSNYLWAVKTTDEHHKAIFVIPYHYILSMDGLKLFVATIRKYNLV